MLKIHYPVMEITSWDNLTLRHQLPAFLTSYGLQLWGRDGDCTLYGRDGWAVLLREGNPESIAIATGGQNENGMHTAVTGLILPVGDGLQEYAARAESMGINTGEARPAFISQNCVSIPSPFGMSMTFVAGNSIGLYAFDPPSQEGLPKIYSAPDHFSLQVSDGQMLKTVQGWLGKVFDDLNQFQTENIQATSKYFLSYPYPFTFSLQHKPKNFTGLNHFAARLDLSGNQDNRFAAVHDTFRIQQRGFPENGYFDILAEAEGDLLRLPQDLRGEIKTLGGVPTLFLNPDQVATATETALFLQFFSGEKMHNGTDEQGFEFEQVARIPIDIHRTGGQRILVPDYDHPERTSNQLFNAVAQAETLVHLFRGQNR